MARRKRDDVPALVIALLARVYDHGRRRAPPWFVDRSALDFADTPESVTAAIQHAQSRGWLVAATEPPQAIAITYDGIRLLEKRGLI